MYRSNRRRIALGSVALPMDETAKAQHRDGGSTDSESSGLTRRDLLRRQAAVALGVLAADALLGAALADRAAASANLTLYPQFYPVSSFTPGVDLHGKLAVITGASTGIGRAAGEALAARGVCVDGTSRDVASVSHPPNFTLLNLDITQPRSIHAFVRRIRRRVGPAGHVDILINNAGTGDRRQRAPGPRRSGPVLPAAPARHADGLHRTPDDDRADASPAAGSRVCARLLHGFDNRVFGVDQRAELPARVHGDEARVAGVGGATRGDRRSGKRTATSASRRSIPTT